MLLLDMNILVAITLIIIACVLAWLAVKIFATLVFTTPVGAVVGLGWGAVWGLAAAAQLGWTSWAPVSWDAIHPVLHVVGWLVGIGSGLLVAILIKDNASDPMMIGAALLLLIIMGPAILAAWSMYFGFIIFAVVMMLAAFKTR